MLRLKKGCKFMDRIYRRESQVRDTPKKKKNEKNRQRNVIQNFRVSPLEKKLIEKRIQMSGLSKSQFFIQSCLYQKILVKGNVKTFAAIRDEIKGLQIAIRDESLSEAITDERREALITIAEILNGIFGMDMS